MRDLQFVWLVLAVIAAGAFALDRNWPAAGGWIFAAVCELQLILLLSK